MTEESNTENKIKELNKPNEVLNSESKSTINVEDSKKPEKNDKITTTETNQETVKQQIEENEEKSEESEEKGENSSSEINESKDKHSEIEADNEKTEPDDQEDDENQNENEQKNSKKILQKKGSKKKNPKKNSKKWEEEFKKKYPINLIMFDFEQCDAKRCTGRKLERMKLIKSLKINCHFSGILLTPNPKNLSTRKSVSKEDLQIILKCGIGVIDCSWNQLDNVNFHKMKIVEQNQRLCLY